MNDRAYKAAKTRSNRPGWSVTFSHPLRRDTRGSYGLKVRRGLGTTDDGEADRLVAQINELLSDRSWWDVGRRAAAAQHYDHAAVAAFFDGIEFGKVNPLELRDGMIPLPARDEGYARVMLVGVTGAGKTTLLRHLIGSDHKLDRFPSISTAKTTTADIEIVLADGPYEAVVTFMNEHETRVAVEECLEQACGAAVRDRDDEAIAEFLLEHQEQRFRLSYPLGRWQQEAPEQDVEELFADEDAGTALLPADESVTAADLQKNNERLRGYVKSIRDIARAVEDQIAPEHRTYADMDNPSRRQDWLEVFSEALYDNQDFMRVSLDVVDDIRERFSLIREGRFDSSSEWPATWYIREADREAFLKHVRWFTSNHHQQFGRLLTPLVDGIRVRGPFEPSVAALRDDARQLVLVDGEGLGHSAREATSVSTRITERFPDVDMILLVDNAESPMQAAPLELLRAAGRGGHGNKVAVAFTHFDQVKGDNLRNFDQRRDHVRASIRNATASLRDSEGAPVAEILERKLTGSDFYLGALDRNTSELPPPILEEVSRLLDQMQQSSERSAEIDAAPTYSIAGLELALRDAADGFKRPWEGRLGLSYQDGAPKEHWARIKALCRRIAQRWQNEYNELRPVADFVSQLQKAVSLWLDEPRWWTVQPSEEEKQRVIDGIRRDVYEHMHTLAEQRLVDSHEAEWLHAYIFKGKGSSHLRARQMAQIYGAAAPSITSVREPAEEEFLHEVTSIVRDAVINAGGSVEGSRQ